MEAVEKHAEELNQRIVVDQTSKEEVLNILEKDTRERLFNPLEDPNASAALLAWRQRTSQNGQETVAFTSGVFDVLHANHRAYLLNTKIAAAGEHYARFYENKIGFSWEKLRPEMRKQHLEHFLTRGELKLIVSIDGNMTVSARKGSDPLKGGVPKPIYDWSTRARDVLSDDYSLHGRRMPIADIVTIHDSHQPAFQGTPHGDIMDIAAYLQPDVWSIYFESEDILEAFPADRRFLHTRAIRLTNHDYYTDKLLGGGFSTTKLTQRILGKASLRLGNPNGMEQ